MIYNAIIGFVVCSVAIFYSGKKLSFYGDQISRKTGIGGVWIGLILVAAVTSLPELTLGISSVAIIGSPDLALGEVLGSCIFNLTILSLLDALSPGKPVLTQVAQNHVLAVSLSTILLGMIGLGLFLPDDFVVIGWIGITSLTFVTVYLLSVRMIYIQELHRRPSIPEQDKETTQDNITLRQLIVRYSLHGILVIATAMALPWFGEIIATDTGLSESFIGTVFLAASSSLPEIAVAISAVRIGAIDLAVGNLFGSNMFNILTLSIDDLFYTKGYLLKDASDTHLITTFALIIMNSVAITALVIRPEKKKFYYLAWDTLLILLLYIGTMILLLTD